MVTVEEALQEMQRHRLDLGVEEVPLEEVCGRILAEPVYADRAFPPFDRATKDGIAISYNAFSEGIREFAIAGIQAGGEPQKTLPSARACLEVMTGAVVPEGADTVVMYEQLKIENGVAILGVGQVQPRQNIHYAGEDAQQGEVLLQAPVKLSPRHISTLASVGKARVSVARLPRVAIVSTGDELVGVNEQPMAHQIRKSNVYALQALLLEDGIKAGLYHVQDEVQSIDTLLEKLLEMYDVLLLSGGVSKGKFDYIPDCLHRMGVEKVFHGVTQRPGKPFWFGTKGDKRVFALPGNPVSTYVCYLLYFRAWLGYTINQPMPRHAVQVCPAGALADFTYHRLANAQWSGSTAALTVSYIDTSGSGDLVSLNQANSLVSVPPRSGAQQQVFFTPFSTRFYEYVI